MRARLPVDFPVGLVVVASFVAVAVAFAGLVKLAVALVLLAVAYIAVRRRLRRTWLGRRRRA